MQPNATRTPIVLLILAAIGFAIPLHAQAQTSTPAQLTRETYDHAIQMRSGILLPKLKNGLVVPHWIGSRDEFWYKRETAQGYQFVRVDAATGHARPAFDHEKLAQTFSRLTGSQVSADKLPFDRFEFSADLSAIDITVADKVGTKDYECKLDSLACVASAAKPPAPFEITLFNRVPPETHDPNEGVLRSPDNHWGIFVRDNNLWLREIATNHDRQITGDGQPHFGYGIYTSEWESAEIQRQKAVEAGHHLPPMASYWSPDSRTVMVPRVDERHVADYPFLDSAPENGSFRPKVYSVRLPLVGEKPSIVEWYAFDIPSGAARRINLPYEKLLFPESDTLAICKKWWSSNGRHLYAAAYGANVAAAYLFDVEIATGAVRTVVEEHMQPRMMLSSSALDAVNVWVSSNGADVIWFSQRDGWGHLYLYDGQTGKLRNQITGGNWLVRDIIKVDEKRRQIYLTGVGKEIGNPYYRYLYRLNFDGTDFKLLSPEHADHMLINPEGFFSFDLSQGYEAISPSGKYAVYNFSTPDQPTQTVIRTTDEARLIATFEKADVSELVAAGYHPPEEFVATAADGKTDLWCLFYKPSQVVPGRRYPVVDLNYASPQVAVVPRNFPTAILGTAAPTPAILNELGFAVISVDARGTAYRSRDFSYANYGKLNISGLDDHVAAIKQLSQHFPYIDVNRVGISGTSQGGWSAIRALLEFPDFFKVAVANVPGIIMHGQPPDMDWYAYQGPPVYSDGSQWRPAPNEVPQNWKALDTIAQASRLKGDLMIIMGELDENVLPATVLQFVDALQKEDKDFDLVYMPGSNHVSGWFPHHILRRSVDFLIRHLMGITPPH
ncbi:MAG TPA: DPP IV N-terminal domain-containing protein [Candidatus Angelobacter sp.]